MTSIHRAPASTRATQLRSSISTPRIAEVLTSIVSSSGPIGDGVVAGALHRDAQAAGAGEVDERLHVGGAAGSATSGGTLVDGEVPGLAGGVPAVVAGEHDGAGDAGSRRTATSEESGEIESMRAMVSDAPAPGHSRTSPRCARWHHPGAWCGHAAPQAVPVTLADS